MQYVIIAIGLLLSANAYSASAIIEESATPELEQLDRKHQTFSANFYSHLAHQSQSKLAKVQTVKSLEKVILEHVSNKRNIIATGMIIKNMPLLKNNYNNLVIFRLIKLLLEQNEWDSAKALFDIIKQEADKTLISYAAYHFASFTFKRNKWKQTLKYLEDNISNLPGENYNHALLMKGISLQRLTKHRESTFYYKKIPRTSKHYITARFNMAIANIRQGWWTDGHVIIEDTLRILKPQKREESVSRFYLTMGYSLLNKEYYRNSREAFRNVGLNTSYTNRALLGIALTAINQKDYIGALNAVRILKNKKSFDLPIDESYLLTPYFYERLQQRATASAGYLEAINYYQRRIKGISKILQTNIDLEQYPIDINRKISIEIDKNPIDFSANYPAYILENYLMLDNYRRYLKDLAGNKLNHDFKALKTDYEAIIIKMVRNILKQRMKHLNSYMDQARYGLASLYDKKQVTK